jgi:O-antigen ligase
MRCRLEASVVPTQFSLGLVVGRLRRGLRHQRSFRTLVFQGDSVTHDVVPDERRAKAAAVALGLWATGCLLHEALATAGAAFAAVIALLSGRPTAQGVRRYAWLLTGLGLALVGPSLAGRWPTGSGVARLVDWLLIPAAAVCVTQAHRRWLWSAAIAATTVWLMSCAAAVAQYLGLWPVAEAFDGWRFTRLPFDRVYEAVPGREDRFMAGGLLLHRLKFAHVGVLAVIATASVALQTNRRRFGWVIVTAIGAASVWALPHARAGAVALTCGLLVLVGRSLRGWRGYALIGVVAAVATAIVVASPSVRERFGRLGSDDERSTLVSAGLRAAWEFPLLGVGAGRFHPRDFTPLPVPSAVQAHQGKAHMQWLTFAAEGGVPAALCLLLTMLLFARRGLHEGATGAPGLAVVVAVLLLTVGHDVLFHPEVSMAVMLGLGATFAQKRSTDDPVLAA